MLGTHKHYFIVTNLQTVRDNMHLFQHFEFIRPGPDRHITLPHEEVLMWARFASEARLTAWEEVAGVTPLPHPLESNDEPISDEHMLKLADDIDVAVQPHPTDATKSVFTCKRTGKTLDTNFHTREAMRRVGENRLKSFRFRVF